MTAPVSRHRVTTPFDAHTMATTGISADLEQQHRERPLSERVPTREDWLLWCLYTIAIITGTGILWIAIGIIESAFTYWFGEG